MEWLGKHKSELAALQPEKAPVLVLVSRNQTVSDNPVPQSLLDAGIPCDVAYISAGQLPNGMNKYKFVLAPQWTWDRLPASQRDKVRAITPGNLSDILKSRQAGTTPR